MPDPKPIPVVVDSRLRLPLADLPPDVAAKLHEEFTHDNPDHAREKLRLAARKWSKGKSPTAPETVETWREEDGFLTLPRGGLARMREVLAEHGATAKIIDRRSEGTGPRPVGYRITDRITPAPFQEEATVAAIAMQNCIVRAPTGSGKTLIAQMIAARLGVCTLVLVQTRELFEQWKRRLMAELGLREDDVGIIHGAKAKIRPITIAMVQTFGRRAEKFRGVFGAVIFDEVQRAAANTFFPAIDACDAKYRIGVSADERRKDKKDFLIYDAFGRVAADIDRKTLERDRFILPVEVRLVPTSFEAPWYAALTNEQKQDPLTFDRLLREMIADHTRNELVARIAAEEMKGGHVVLVFSHRVEHCLGLRADVAASDPRVGVLVGDAALRRESDETSAGLRSGKIVCAIGTYQSIGTGVDFPGADRGIATTPIHTNKQGFGQNRGRLCRIDRSPGARKTDAVLHVLWDRAVHGLVPLRNYLRFNGGNVMVLDPSTGVIEDGRAFLRRAEDEEDVAAEARRAR